MTHPVTQYNETILTAATIAASASLSDVVRLPPGHVLVGIVMPATWTAADLTFQFSADNVTYQNAYEDDGTELERHRHRRRQHRRRSALLPLRSLPQGPLRHCRQCCRSGCRSLDRPRLPAHVAT